VELVYEGEQEGPAIVAQDLIGKAIRNQFVNYFPDPEKVRKMKENNPYKKIVDWFGEGHEVDMLNDLPQKEYRKTLDSVPGLKELVHKHHKNSDEDTRYFLMEFALHGLSEFSMLSKKNLVSGLQFKDLLSSMFTGDANSGNIDEFNES
jgi:magnesium chelatase subunit I